MARHAFHTDSSRNRELARIHVGKARLGMADDEYRGMLQALARVDSAAALDDNGRRKVIGHLARLGAFHAAPTEDKQARLIRHLWHRLHQLGEVQHGDETALRGFCDRVAHRAAVQWLSVREANVVIEALKSWVARAERKQAAAAGTPTADPVTGAAGPRGAEPAAEAGNR